MRSAVREESPSALTSALDPSPRQTADWAPGTALPAEAAESARRRVAEAEVEVEARIEFGVDVGIVITVRVVDPEVEIEAGIEFGVGVVAISNVGRSRLLRLRMGSARRPGC